MTIPFIVEKSCDGDFMTKKSMQRMQGLGSPILENATIADVEHAYYAANPSEGLMLQKR